MYNMYQLSHNTYIYIYMCMYRHVLVYAYILHVYM